MFCLALLIVRFPGTKKDEDLSKNKIFCNGGRFCPGLPFSDTFDKVSQVLYSVSYRKMIKHLST